MGTALMNWKGGGHELIEALFRHFSGGIEEKL
jgi:hypothetical protein